MLNSYFNQTSKEAYKPDTENLSKWIQREFPNKFNEMDKEEKKALEKYVLIKNYFEMFPEDQREEKINETKDYPPHNDEFESGVVVLKPGPQKEIYRLYHQYDSKKISRMNAKAKLNSGNGMYFHTLIDGTQFQITDYKSEEEQDEYLKEEKMQKMIRRLEELEKKFLKAEIKE